MGVSTPDQPAGRQVGPRRSIRTRLITAYGLLFVAAFVLVFLVELVGVPFTSYGGRLGGQRAEAFLMLEQKADLLKVRLLTWLQERRAGVLFFASNPQVRQSVEVLSEELARLRQADGDEKEAWERLRRHPEHRRLEEFLSWVIKVFGRYRRVSVVEESSGRVVCSSEPGRLGMEMGQMEAVRGALMTRGGYVSDVHHDEQSGLTSMDFGHVVRAASGQATGVLVVEVDAEEILTPLLKYEDKLGMDETVLVNSACQNLLSTSRPQLDGSLPGPLESLHTGLPARLAAQGEEGSTESNDYRGQAVLAAYRHVQLSPEVGWGLVVKRDLAAVYAPIWRETWHSALVAASGLVLVLVLSALLGGALTRPLRRLALVADRISAGETWARAGVSSPDEVGHLGRAFDEMLEKMNDLNRRLEEKVARRTAQLEQANQDLTQEILERRRVEEDLRESEKRQGLLLEHSLDGVLLTDQWGGILSANPAACQMLGYTAFELAKLGPGQLLDLEDTLSLAALRERARSGAFRGTMTFLRKDGTRLPVEVTSRLFKDKHGQTLATTILRDLSDRRRAEEERGRLEAQVRRMQKMEALGTLAGGIAHDFNNILAAILGYAELARKNLDPQAKARGDLEQLLLAVQRAKELVRQILSFGRTGEQARQPLNLTPLVRETLSLLRATLPAGIAMEVQLEDEGAMVMGDAIQLHQVLMNLASNAAQAMRSSGGLIKISCHQTTLEEDAVQALPELRPGAFHVLSVADNGPGMDAVTLEHLFEPYFTTKPPGEGSGLGLAVVHGIVKRHGGAVVVESAPGRGSNFQVFLPALDSLPPDAPAPPLPPLPRGSERIMLVDDEKSLTEVGKRMLEELGYRVLAFNDPREALMAFERSPQLFDLVITDLNMPGMNGIALARTMRAARPGLPVVLCSGYADKEATAQVKALGLEELMTKPLSLRQLAEVVRRSLDGWPTPPPPDQEALTKL